MGIFFLLNNTGHINKIALSFMNHHIDGEMYFDSLRFDFKEFPVIDVKAKNGLLLSGISIPKGDTLCYFDVLEAKMNPFDIAKSMTITIPYVYLYGPYAKVELNEIQYRLQLQRLSLGNTTRRSGRGTYLFAISPQDVRTG